MANTVEVTLKTPVWDEDKKLYRPGTRAVPRALAVRLGLVKEDEGETGGAAPAGDSLPDDFPFREALEKLGVKTVEDVKERGRDGLIALVGIGEAKADKILAHPAVK